MTSLERAARRLRKRDEASGGVARETEPLVPVRLLLLRGVACRVARLPFGGGLASGVTGGVQSGSFSGRARARREVWGGRKGADFPGLELGSGGERLVQGGLRFFEN